jgi:hypothetical protein
MNMFSTASALDCVLLALSVLAALISIAVGDGYENSAGNYSRSL